MTISDTTRTPDLPAGFDVTDPAVLGERIPFEEFAELRRNAPVWWCEQPPTVGGFQDEGYWVVSRHADVKEVSQRSDVFSSWENTAIARFADDMPREAVEMLRHLLLNKDAPEHTKLRKLISKLFTPRAINGMRDELDRRARSIVDTAVSEGPGDFVKQVASELPLQAIADLIGVPQDDRDKLFKWSNEMMGYDDPEYQGDPAVASTEVLGYAYQMADARRTCPADDIVTTLVQADIRRRLLEPGGVRVLRAHPGGRRERDHSQRHHARNDRVPGQPRAVGAVQEGTSQDDGRRDRPLGDTPSPPSSAPRSRTRNWQECRSRRGSAW